MKVTFLINFDLPNVKVCRFVPQKFVKSDKLLEIDPTAQQLKLSAQ